MQMIVIFLKCANRKRIQNIKKIKKKNMKPSKTNFEGAYLSDGWMDLIKIGIAVALPRGRFHSKTG